MTKYYYSKDGQDVQGPLASDDIQKMYSAGILLQSTQVCREGTEEWKPITFLFPVASRSAPPKQLDPKIISAPKPRDQKQMVLLVVALVLIASAIGNVHIITGSHIKGFKIFRKDSFGFTETFINVDMVTGMPWIAARSRFPIGCSVLQREDLIESDEAFEGRNKREFERKMEDAQKETQRLLRQYQ